MLKVKKHTITCDPIKGFNQPIKSGLVRGLQDTLNRNDTLLEDLQITIKPTLIKRFSLLLQWLESNNDMI